jgi:hypothetical protein
MVLWRTFLKPSAPLAQPSLPRAKEKRRVTAKFIFAIAGHDMIFGDAKVYPDFFGF